MHREAVTEVVVSHLDNRLIPAITHFRDLEKQCWDVADALTQMGDPQTGQRIAELIRDAKGRVPAPSAEPSAGRQFLDQLRAHPAGARL